MRMLDKLNKTAEANRDRIAVKSGDKQLTYAELFTQAAALAGWLAEHTEKREPLIVYGHKDPLMLVCFLACVMSGHAYCPVDTSMPADRISAIAAAVEPEWFLATEPYEEEKNILAPERIREIAVGPAPATKPVPVGDDETFYIIFTSGSTGTPKGVEISASALDHFTEWARGLSRDETEEARVYMNQAPLSFDLSVMDLYTSLTVGGTWVCITSDLQKNMGEMFRVFGKSGITHWVSTPSFADLCLADPVFNEDLMPALSTLLFCGETLTKRTAGRLMERFPEAVVINTYGPTESTVAITDITVTEDLLAAEGELPIGRPKPGTSVEIDPENGEMLILGDTVSLGYFRDKEKTEKAFFEGSLNGAPVRGYRTGDAGEIKDGLLYYKGRLDRQIKFHGYRIELGDVEANLMELPGVSMAAVVTPKKDGKIRFLAAFVSAEQGAELDRKSIRQMLKERLPDYMIPKRIFVEESLPLTGNGKIDRKSLEARLS